MEEDKLNEIYELTKENNRMLHAMRRHALIGTVVKGIFWILVLVVIPYFSWLYIQPYVNDVLKTYNGVKSTTNSVQASGSADITAIQKFFSQFGGSTAK